MKRLKDINLVSSYMNPAKVRFYTTDWSPNGTAGLLICDDMDQIIDFIDEALFSPTLSDNSCGDTLGGIFLNPYGDSIHFIGNSDEPTESDLESEDRVYPLRIDQVLDSIAVSPTQSRMDVLRKLVKGIKEAG